MPSVDVAMASSLRPRAWELIGGAVARGLSRRNVVGDAQGTITDVKTAFSSWDNCMEASFCKWPVIAIIVVGSLIVLSVVWCIVRCACFGLSCCCTCFSCLKCCGNCCGCCDPPGRRKNKYMDEPYVSPNQGYRSVAPMQSSLSPAMHGAAPQYAQFDVRKKGGEDALPQMPSWEQSGSTKVMMTEEVEMTDLKKPPASDPTRDGMLVTPMSHDAHHSQQPYRGLGGQMSNHSQQALLASPQPSGYSQSRGSPYSARDVRGNNHGRNDSDHYFASRQPPGGFGRDEPYDTPQSTPGPPGMQGYAAQNGHPYGNGPSSPYGAAGVARAPHSNGSPPHNQPYGAAAMGHGSRRSPPSGPGRAHHDPFGQQEQAYDQYAEMPAVPSDRSRPHTPASSQRQRFPGATPPPPLSSQNSPMELAGSEPPVGAAFGIRPQAAGDMSPVGPRPPYGMPPRVRNSPGPRNHANDSPYSPSPRASPGPRHDQGYGRPPMRDNSNRSYSPAPPRNLASGPERHYSPGLDGTASPAPLARASPPGPAPNQNAFAQSPPHTPITNNSGFDFTSGFSRPPGQSSPAPAYPGQRAYQTGS